MRIGIVYTDVTSYMTDCWKALSSREGVEVKVWVEQRRADNMRLDYDKTLQWLDAEWFFEDEVTETIKQRVEVEILAFKPDIVLVCGWARNLPPYVTVSRRLKHIPMVLDHDMPWEWRLRKVAARFVLWNRLRRFSAAFVPGEISYRYSRWLGFRKDRIFRGRNCIDLNKWQSPKTVVRKGFVFVGRLVPEKDIPTLAEAYNQYNGDWELDVYGVGPERRWIEGIKGINLHGFARPDELPAIYAKAGAIILPSKSETWGVVLAEAAACGCPIICSSACGGKYELVRDNGVVFKAGDVRALARAMGNAKSLNGDAGRELVEEFSCEKWADRVMNIASVIGSRE